MPHTFLKLSHVTSGVMNGTKNKKANYIIAHINTNRTAQLYIARNAHKPYSSRQFLLLPELKHVENFALASAHVMSNAISNNFPFAVGSIDILESPGHLIINSIQANYNRKKINDDSPLVNKKDILPPQIDQAYANWSKTLLAKILEHYKHTSKPIIYPDAKQYELMWRVKPTSAERIQKEIENTAQKHGYITRHLKQEEIQHYGLNNAQGKFKIIER